jgi:hypothetical protein
MAKMTLSNYIDKPKVRRPNVHAKTKTSLNLKKVKIMSRNIEDKEDNNWALQLGLYPGIVVGFRTYHNENSTIHVLYVPFIDIALIIPN